MKKSNSRQKLLILTCACGVYVALATWTRTAAAVDYSWINPAGGAFGQPTFWTPFDPVLPPPIYVGPGGASDTVNFDLGIDPANRYTVTGIGGENDRLLVHNDSLTLDIADYALLSDEPGLDAISFVVGVSAGDSADVMLTAAAGATFDTYRTTIAHDAASVGTIAVAGADWQWSAGQTFVGEWGAGTLDIASGAALTSGLSHVGMFADSTGVVTIRGAGSSWHSSSANVGGIGLGSVTIEDGGSYTTNHMDLGNGVLGNGTIAVRGTGSSWTSDGPMFVGYSGTGTIAVEDGGAFASRGGSLGGWDGEGFGTATVTVEGVGSVWNVVSVVGQEAAVSIGRASTATLTIRDGGAVSNPGRSYLGYNAGASGIANVSGVGSNWTHGGDLFVGREGSGGLTVEAAAAAVNATGWIGDLAGSTGSVAVRGARSTWTNNGELFVGNAGSGELTIEAGGTVESNGVWIGSSPGALGDATVRGARSTWNAAGQFIVGYRSQGIMTIESGGSVINDGNSFIGFVLTNDSRATVTGDGSTWTNSGSLAVGHNGEGTLSVERRGLVTARGGMTVGTQGRATGDGTIAADVTNSGVVAPGSVLGTLHIDGGYVQSPLAGILEIELASADMYDRLEVSGSASLDGALDVTTVGGFTPALPGESFAIVAASSLIGEFSQVLGTPSPSLPGLFWTVDYTPTAAILSTSAVPGDINLDGSVNRTDAALFAAHFGTPAGSTWLTGDFNFDAATTFADLELLLSHLGQREARSPAVVPEPSSILLMLPVALAVAFRRVKFRR